MILSFKFEVHTLLLNVQTSKENSGTLDILFERQGQWQSLGPAALVEQLTAYATELGVQESSFESCLSSPSMADEVARDLADASQYGATGTPGFFIGNEENGYDKLVGAQPYSSFQATIDSLLN